MSVAGGRSDNEAYELHGVMFRLFHTYYMRACLKPKTQNTEYVLNEVYPAASLPN